MACTLAAAVLVAADEPEPAGFSVKLNLKNGHLAELHFGCRAGATDGYDQQFDAMAPPPGIETGFTAFMPAPGQGGFPLYQDVRAPAPEVVWHFGAKVFPGKPVIVSWDPKALPADHDFTVSGPDGDLDMRVADKVEVGSSATLQIVARRRAAAATAAPATTTTGMGKDK